MSEEIATLKDVTVSPSPSAEKPKEEAKPIAAEAKVEVTDPALAEAAEIGRILIDSGWTKGQINDLMQAPKALASLQSLLTTDPKQFVKQLAIANPEAASKLRDTVAEEYVELYGKKGEEKQGGKGADSELMGEVASLRSEISQFRTEREQASARAALAATQARYNSRVDDFFSQEGIKNLSLNKSEQAGIRALLDKELAADPTIVQRVSNGNFVDVAPKFKNIVENWAADKKSANEAEQRAREGVESGASFTFPGGPEALKIDNAVFDDWDATENAFAKALTRAR